LRFEYRICELRNRIAAYMKTTVITHRLTDKIKEKDSYEARVVHMVHIAYIVHMVHIAYIVHMVHKHSLVTMSCV